MRSAERLFLAFFLTLFSGIALSACGKSSSSGPPSTGGCPVANSSCTSAAGPTPIPTSAASTLPLYVADSSTTGQWGYPDEPLVSVTICTPNHTSSSQCQTISNILLDTGSYGLRIFGSAITNGGVQLVPQTITVQGSTLNLAECALFGTGADWGAVENADVLLGNQTASNIPIQVIDVNYASIPKDCSDLCPDTDPCTSGFNGILGVGPFTQDCGSNCETGDDQVNPGIYFGCDGTGCFDAYNGSCGTDGVCVFQPALGQQVGNPVASFATGFSNGVAVALPGIGSSGASAITSGSVTLGIGTPSSVVVYPADPSGMTDGKGMDIVTSFGASAYGYGSSDGSIAFLDSGSNGIFFPGGLTTCQGGGFYCPSSTQPLSATIAGYTGSPTYGASFSIANAQDLFNSGMTAFDNVGGPSSKMFDWGLPFFFGKTIYVGISGASATINGSSATGPYWAF